MKQSNKTFCSLVLALMAVVLLRAEPIALSDAVTAAENWIAAGEVMEV